MAKFNELPSVKLHNKVSDLRIYFNSKYDCKNNQIERQHYNYIVSKAINLIAELKYDDSNRFVKQLAKLQLQNVVVKAEYATKINNPKYLDQYVTLYNYIKESEEVKFKGVNNDNKAVTITKLSNTETIYSIGIEQQLLKNHSVYRTSSFDGFVKILEEVCHDTRFEMYDYINNKNI